MAKRQLLGVDDHEEGTVDLADVEVPAAARFVAKDLGGDASTWQLRCDHPGCHRVADSIHFLLWVVDVERIEAACAKHDPGGYWIKTAELFSQPFQILGHLAGKRGGAAKALLEWLMPGW
jgi:hypothetical protein